MDKSILEVVHESAKDLHDVGLMDVQTMREFDALCLPEVKKYNAKEIKVIRLENQVSQAVFASYLNTAVETVRKWEAVGGTNKIPNGAAMKLINMVADNGLEILGKPLEAPVQSKRVAKKTVRAATR